MTTRRHSARHSHQRRCSEGFTVGSYATRLLAGFLRSASVPGGSSYFPAEAVVLSSEVRLVLAISLATGAECSTIIVSSVTV